MTLDHGLRPMWKQEQWKKLDQPQLSYVQVGFNTRQLTSKTNGSFEM